MTLTMPEYPYPLSSAEQTSSVATVDGQYGSTFAPSSTYHNHGNGNDDGNHYYNSGAGYHHQHPYYNTSAAPHTLITGVLLCLMLILFILLCYLAIPLVMDFIRSRMPVSTMKKERRLLTIEGWLITKKARAHCATCQEVQSQYCQKAVTKQSKLQLSPSYDTAETEPMRDFDDVADIDEVDSGKECAVCMERFKANDVVSWSPTAECSHVFHHECIKEWLVFHDNCPYCRVTVLPVDDLKTQSSSRSGIVSANWGDAELTKLAKERTQRARTSYFCIEEGLITIDNPIPSTMESRKHRRFLGSRIKQGELSTLRGSRSAANGGSVESIPSPVSTDSDGSGVEVVIR